MQPGLLLVTGRNQPDLWQFNTEGNIGLRIALARKTGISPKRVVLQVLDSEEPLPTPTDDTAFAQFFPRGSGNTGSALSAADQIEVRRRYMLLGQTLDSMRVWDIRRAIAALRSKELFGDTPITLVGYRDQAINALYASLFIEGLAGVELTAPPTSHVTGPDYLNVLRYLDVPQAVAIAAERQPVQLRQADRDAWSWTTKTTQQLGWPADRLRW